MRPTTGSTPGNAAQPEPPPLAGQPPGPQPLTGPAALLGAVGALGDELLGLLLSLAPPHALHVAVTRPLQTALAQFVPFVWRADGEGAATGAPADAGPPARTPTAWPRVDAAWLVITPPDARVPRGTPLQPLRLADVPAAAASARAAGVATLVVVAPLAALLQLGGLAAGLASTDELALADLGFERLVVVRPSTDDEPVPPGTGLAGLGHRIVRSATRAVRDIMLPHTVQPLSARSAAQAIVALAGLAPPGVRVLGARELHAWVDARTGVPRTRRAGRVPFSRR